MSGKIIIGAGRHAAETYYLLEDLGMVKDLSAFVVDKPQEGQQLLGVKVISTESLLEQYSGSTEKPPVLVAVGDTESNKRLARLFSDSGFPFFSAITKEIRSDRQKFIGRGVTIAQGCILTCNISIGDHSIINIGCTISHDCVIGNHVNISPGCHLAGNVSIEDDVFVGTGATFIPKVKVGKGSIIAAGACVTRDVQPYSMVAGVPAVTKKSLKQIG